MQPAEASPSRAYGIDVSQWQGEIDWSKVVHGRINGAHDVAFAYIRASVGGGLDTQAVRNVQAARGASLPFGCYHYAVPGTVGSLLADAGRQASVFVDSLADPRHADLPPALDLEENPNTLNPADLLDWLLEWGKAVDDGAGQRLMLYTNPGFWEHSVAPALSGNAARRTQLTDRFDLWVAHWYVAAPGAVAGWPDWTFWQTSDRGTVDGIVGAVDVDQFNGPASDLPNLARTSNEPTITAQSLDRARTLAEELVRVLHG